MEDIKVNESYSDRVGKNVDENIKNILSDMIDYSKSMTTISGSSPYAKDVQITFQQIFNPKKKYKASEVDKETWLRVKNKIQGAINTSNVTLDRLNDKLRAKELELRSMSKNLEVNTDDIGNKFLDLGYEIENIKLGIRVAKTDIAMLRKGLTDVISRSSKSASDIKLSQAALTIMNSTLSDPEALQGMLVDYDLFKSEAEKRNLMIWQVVVDDTIKERTSETLLQSMTRMIELMLLILGTHIEYFGRNEEIITKFPKINWEKETPVERYSEFNEYWSKLIIDLADYLNNPANEIDIQDRDVIAKLITYGKQIILDDFFKDAALREKIFVPSIKTLSYVNYKKIEPIIKGMMSKIDKIDEDQKVFLFIYVLSLITDPGFFPVVLLYA